MIKAVPFVVISAIFFLHLVSQWYSILFSFPWIGISIFAFTLSIFGAVARKNLINNYADLSVGSWALGSLFLLAGLGLYIYGTLSGPPYVAWAQFESAIFFILSFISFCYDWRIVRATALLFLVVGLAFPSPWLSSALGAHSSYYATALGMLIVFLIFARRDLRLMIGPFIASTFVFAYSLFHGTFGSIAPYVVPLCFIVYAVPALRKQRGRREIGAACKEHVPELGGFGFCSVCGKKYAASAKLPRLGLGGLVIIFLVLALLSLPLIEIPVLQLQSGSAPQYGLYSRNGVSTVDLPITPQGWLTNSSSALSLSGDLYATKNVYVPVSNPDRSNYTLYYELSQASQTNMSNAWRDVFGWNRAVTILNLGGLHGSLIVYSPTNITSGNDTLNVYSGSERLTFLHLFGANLVTMQMSFTRNFSSSVSSRQAATIFVSDLQTYWGGWISDLCPASSWCRFLFSMYYLFLSIFTVVAIIASSSLIIFASYRAMQSDSKTDDFLDTASDLD